MTQAKKIDVFDAEHMTRSNSEGIVSRGLEHHIRGMLKILGEDPDREGLLETPERVSRAWAEWTEGYYMNPADVLKSFEDGVPGAGEMILVSDIPIYSHCEHHLAPFFGRAHIAYIPDGRIVGLSKFERLVNVYSRRLQVQERMTSQIADAFFECARPLGVAVIVRCRHMCMESRGVRTRTSTTLTSASRGCFVDDQSVRSELFSMLRLQTVNDTSNEP